MELGSAVEAYVIYQMDAGADKSDRGVVLVVRPDRGGSDIKGGNRRISTVKGAGGNQQKDLTPKPEFHSRFLKVRIRGYVSLRGTLQGKVSLVSITKLIS